jgi:hypothetical protein
LADIIGRKGCCTKPLARQGPPRRSLDVNHSGAAGAVRADGHGGLDRFETMRTDPQRIKGPFIRLEART